MIRMKRILLTTDFSECAVHATRYACAFAERFEAILHVLHVIDDIFLLPEYRLATDPQDLLLEARTEAKQTLERVLDPVWRGKNRVVLTVNVGRPAAEIVSYSGTQETDLIVMSTHGRGGLMHALLGSVAEKVVRKASCPVLTVPPSAP